MPELRSHEPRSGFGLGDRSDDRGATLLPFLPMVEVRVYYDVVCPYSYMESHVLEAAEDAGRARVEWLPLELRPAPRPLLEPRGDHLRVDWTRNVYRRALELGVEIHLPRYQPRSTLPLAACLWAQEQGRLRDFKHALYEAFFCEGEDIAADREIARAAGRIGLDPDGAVAAAYSTALQQPDRRDPAARQKRRACAACRRSSPPRRKPLGHGRDRAPARRRAARAPSRLTIPLRAPFKMTLRRHLKGALSQSPDTSKVDTSGSSPTFRISSVPRGTGATAR